MVAYECLSEELVEKVDEGSFRRQMTKTRYLTHLASMKGIKRSTVQQKMRQEADPKLTPKFT